MMEENNLILVMEAGQKEALQVEFPFAQEKTYLLTSVSQGVDYDIEDPASSPSQTQAILNEVAELVRAGYLQICELAEASVSR